MELLELPTLILKVSNLECENRLDKVYGILSMVRWNDNEKPIRTDYTKDRFDLALETLEVIARRRVPNLISYGERVARNLDLLEDPSPKLKEAIQKRGVPPVMPEASDFAETRELTDTGFNPNSRSRIVFEGCRLTKNGKGEWGFQATNDRGNAEETTGPYHSKRPHQWPVSVTTMDLLGDAPILIPKRAQDGDWCLYMKWSRIEADTLILIAREHVDKRHLWIVGKGWGERPVTLGQENGESRNFHVYLGAEDAMVISIQCPMHSWPSTTLRGIQNFIESGVCGSPGSSYAELDWS
nr:uncharacterized protein CTRU02_12205 [Colletotrichum truncatum]KAF6784994.1 hypothetical protein CTRU02_12205 [Colletotrichum truncatum]